MFQSHKTIFWGCILQGNFTIHTRKIRKITSSGARIAQSVYRRAAGWTTEGSEFESRWGQEFSLLRVFQTDSGVHTTSYPMNTEVFFPVGKTIEA
jgi:hypothetical protein